MESWPSWPSWPRELPQRAFVLLDGGLATELERRGCSLADPLWSAKILLEQPEQIVAVHRDFLAAGADVIATASYQASFPGLAARGLEPVRPSLAERAECNRIIMDELVNGIFEASSTRYFQEVIAGLKDRGCDAVVLGCTEIPLIVDDRNSPLPTLDSTRLLARAALRRAVEA